MNYRVVVLGAGPGGCLLARELARGGVPVDLYERSTFEELGHDWSDAVEREPLAAAGLDMPDLQEGRWKGSLVKDDSCSEGKSKGVFESHAIPRLKLYSPDYGTVYDLEFKMITTDRRKLAQLLVQQARKAGAGIYYRREALRLLYRETGNSSPEGVEVYGVQVRELETGEIKEIAADVIVESTGFHSILRRSLPPYTGMAGEFAPADFALVHREVRARVPEKASGDPVPDHYRYGYQAGYQWSHIHNEHRIDIGAGVGCGGSRPDPRNIVEEFISRHPSIGKERIRGGRSFCVVGPPLVHFTVSGFLVLGDAASMSIPSTGCGVGSALQTGRWASRVLLEAAYDGRTDLEKLWEFNWKFFQQEGRGAHLAAISFLRLTLQSLAHSSLNFLFHSGLLGAGELEQVINGKFPRLSFQLLLEKIKPAARGVKHPALLKRTLSCLASSSKIYYHYCKYPAQWDKKSFYAWKNEANKLFNS